MFHAVLFDLDGTLIDTEKYYRICWPRALAHFDYEMTDEMALSMRSLGRPFAPARLKEWYGEDFDYPKVREYRKHLMEEMIAAEGIAIKPGAVALLTQLKEQEIIRAVTTATDHERTERYLKKVGLEGYFDRIISATDVKEGKPSPDIYAYACRELGFSPQECLAVEDSPNGVRSAYSAGCRVVMVPDQTGPDEELRGMLYGCVQTLEEVMGLLL